MKPAMRFAPHRRPPQLPSSSLFYDVLRASVEVSVDVAKYVGGYCVHYARKCHWLP